jgi:flagellar motor switch protein FliN/FliY
MADSEQIGQEEIDELLRQAEAGKTQAAADAPSPRTGAGIPDPLDIESLLKSGGAAAPTAATFPAGGATAHPHNDIELLLNHAQAALASVAAEQNALPPGAQPFTLQDFAGSPASTEAASFDLVRDVELDLEIELGRTHMYLEDVLKLRKGSVVSLDKLAGDPVDIYVNGRLIARGEVLVLNDNFCVRVAELVVGERADGG